jgi:glycosyltransferase involved in cell wall biosynthesis
MGLEQLTVLHINKYHHMIGGSEAVYFRTSEILERHGHKSLFFSMRHPDNVPCATADYFVPYIDLERHCGKADLIRASGNVLYSFTSKRLLSKLLDRYTVDLAHVHNIHRQMSPSILHELKKRKIPVVMTLHEYKMVCPSFNLNLLTHAIPCEACAGGRYYNAAKVRCIKDSLLRSSLASVEMYLHHTVLDIYKNVDVFISPSKFLRDKLREMGFKKEIMYLPNSVDIEEFDQPVVREREFENDKPFTVVYFGRLFYGKGLFTLLDAVEKLFNRYNQNEILVKIIGEGILGQEMKEKARKKGLQDVKFLGYLSGEKLFREVRDASVVVLPSECYENNPLQVIESFAVGIPVVGARIAGIPELVKDGKTGLTFESGDSEDLCSKIQYMISNPEEVAEMGKNARVFVEQKLNAETYYNGLMELYKKGIIKGQDKLINKN